MTELTLNVTQERLKTCHIGWLRKSQTGDLLALFNFIAHFVSDGQGGYLSHEDAIAAIDNLTLGELEDVAGQLYSAASEAAAPKATG